MRHKIITLIGTSLILTACGNAQTGLKVSEDGTVSGTPLSQSEIANMDLPGLLDETTTLSEQITTVLTNVNDETSARAAVNTLSELGPQFKLMAERMETMDESEMTMSLSMIQALSKFGSAQMGLFNEVERIGKDHPELGAILKDEFEKLEF